MAPAVFLAFREVVAACNIPAQDVCDVTTGVMFRARQDQLELRQLTLSSGKGIAESKPVFLVYVNV